MNLFIQTFSGIAGRRGANPKTLRLVTYQRVECDSESRDASVEVFKLGSRDRNCHRAHRYTNHREGDVFPTNQATPRLASVIKEA